MNTTKRATVAQVCQDLLADSRMWTHEKMPFVATLHPGHPRVVLVAGENSTGKSVFVEGVLGWGHKHFKTSPLSVSIRERTGGGLYEGAAFRRAVMFGDEHEHSTGATSARVVETAFKNVQSRAEEDKAAILVLDEPELGLSEGYACAMGSYLALQALAMHEKACGLVVVTHSRGLARNLAQSLGQAPTFVKLGEPRSFDQWLESVETRSVQELLELGNKDLTGWRDINALYRLLKEQS